MNQTIVMRRILLLAAVLILFWTATGCSAQKASYRERLSDAKGLALSTCVTYMNASDDSLSVRAADYSSSYFVQLSRLSLDEIVQIQDYVKEHWQAYWAIPQEIGGTMIGYSAWRFSTSKELDAFLRRTIKRRAQHLAGESRFFRIGRREYPLHFSIFTTNFISL